MSAPTLFLYGAYELCFDDKSRAVMPAAFRRLLQEECAGALVITQSLFDRCLWLYPQTMWDNLLSALNNLSTAAHPAVGSMQRLLLANAQSVKLDGQGRFAVSTLQRSAAALTEKKCTLVGLQHKFELWAPELLNEKQESDRAAVRAAFAAPEGQELFAGLRI